MCFSVRRVIALSVFCLLFGVTSTASAHKIFLLRFNPATVNVDKPGFYRSTITVDPNFWHTGLLVMVNPGSLPDNVVGVVFPPVWYFTNATSTKDLTLYLFVFPGAPNGARQLQLDVTQYIFPAQLDEERYAGPTVNINITPDSSRRSLKGVDQLAED